MPLAFFAADPVYDRLLALVIGKAAQQSHTARTGNGGGRAFAFFMYEYTTPKVVFANAQSRTALAASFA